MGKQEWAGAAMAAVLATGFGPVSAQGADADQRLRDLEGRVQVLERENGAVEPVITLAGLIEVEAGFGEDYAGGSFSDVVLATAELAMEARVNDWTTAQLVYLHEQDDTEPGEIDQGIVTFGNPEMSPVYLSGGRMYVPFGHYATYLVSDPLTLELGEMRESALQVGFEASGLYGSVYAFNGDSQEAGDDDVVAHSGVNLGYAAESEGVAVDVGGGYISSLADSDAIAGAEVDIDGDGISDWDPAALKTLPAGTAAHAVVSAGPWHLVGEFVGATERFDAVDLPFDGKGARPAAWNIEAGYAFTLAGRNATFAVARQQTREALNLGLPETRTLAGISMGMMENAAISVEYAADDDYGTGEGGTGESAHAVTVQLAAEF